MQNNSKKVLPIEIFCLYLHIQIKTNKMKKIIIPVAVALTVALAMTSCKKAAGIESSKTISVNGAEESITTVTFEGHEYLIYDGYNSGSMCHSESCDCKTPKSE